MFEEITFLSPQLPISNYSKGGDCMGERIKPLSFNPDKRKSPTHPLVKGHNARIPGSLEVTPEVATLQMELAKIGEIKGNIVVDRPMLASISAMDAGGE